MRRILLVDDELAILLTLKAILEMHGFEVETAASAREAEQKLGSDTFDMKPRASRSFARRAADPTIRPPPF
jgi:DNA-binding NtrC family response regulator